MLFPWLYPGGNGDLNESRKVDIGVKDWARQQLFMADGRFAPRKYLGYIIITPGLNSQRVEDRFMSTFWPCWERSLILSN
jgi:hypothetical protein